MFEFLTFKSKSARWPELCIWQLLVKLRTNMFSIVLLWYFPFFFVFFNSMSLIIHHIMQNQVYQLNTKLLFFNCVFFSLFHILYYGLYFVFALFCYVFLRLFYYFYFSNYFILLYKFKIRFKLLYFQATFLFFSTF